MPLLEIQTCLQPQPCLKLGRKPMIEQQRDVERYRATLMNFSLKAFTSQHPHHAQEAGYRVNSNGHLSWVIDWTDASVAPMASR